MKESEVPVVVLNAFKEKYDKGKTKVLEWEKENNNYIVKFKKAPMAHIYKLKGNKAKKVRDIKIICEATYTIDGKWIMTETKLKTEEIPQAIKDTLTSSSKFQGWKINKAKEQNNSVDGIIYELKVTKGKNKETLLFYKNGALLPLKPNMDNNQTINHKSQNTNNK